MGAHENTELHPETLAVGAGYDPAAHHGAIKPPLYATSTFGYPTAAHAKAVHARFFGAAEESGPGAHENYIYARLDHPNLAMIETRLAALDGGEDAAVFNSGMAAVNAVMQAFLRPGETVLHTRPIYGGTDGLLYAHLHRFGIEAVAIADALDPGAVRDAIGAARGRVGLVIIETPANPLGSIADIAAIAEAVAPLAPRPVVVVDNTFLGPFAQNPLRHGADLCLTSLTKYAGGHSDLLAGGVSGDRARIHALRQLRTFLGSTADAHTAWLLLRSLETMHLRTARASSNALAIARFLRGHHAVASVNHLAFREAGSREARVFARQCRDTGSTFTFRIRGGEPACFAVLDRLRVLRMAVSLGGTETLICHPASTTHFNVPEARRRAAGIDDDVLRISVGVEHVDDLVADLRQALECA